MLKTLRKLYMWLSVAPNKKKADYIKVEKNKRIINFNKKKIYFSEIKEINSNTEKNYSKLITSENVAYYYNDSIENIIKIASEPFVRINKKTAVNYFFIEERLNNSFVFIKNKPYPVGDSYKKSVEDFFIGMQNKGI